MLSRKNMKRDRIQHAIRKNDNIFLIKGYRCDAWRQSLSEEFTCNDVFNSKYLNTVSVLIHLIFLNYKHI